MFEGVPCDATLLEQLARQIDALRVLISLADRAGIALAVSDEVVRQARGGTHVQALADAWQLARQEWGIEDRGLAPMTLVATLPLRNQLVLAQAFRSGCDAVLTNDLRWTRPKHQRTIAALGMRVYTPEQLLEEIRPWLALWL